MSLPNPESGSQRNIKVHIDMLSLLETKMIVFPFLVTLKRLPKSPCLTFNVKLQCQQLNSFTPNVVEVSRFHSETMAGLCINEQGVRRKCRRWSVLEELVVLNAMVVKLICRMLINMQNSAINYRVIYKPFCHHSWPM